MIKKIVLIGGEIMHYKRILSTRGASLVTVMSTIIIFTCLFLLVISFALKQDDTQSETVILGYERTARNAAREAFRMGNDSLGETFSKKSQVDFIIDSKGKRIYALKEGESLAELTIRLRAEGVKPIENYGEKLTFTSDDPWKTRFVDISNIPDNYYYGEVMKKGRTYDLRKSIIFVSIREKNGEYNYYQWWQNTEATSLLEY